MGRVLLLLCALVLLLSLGAACVEANGELCRAWTYGMELSSRVFQCPKRVDGADAKFCCGTCSLPYCCSSREVRLNQAQCSAKLKVVSDTVVPGTRRSAPSQTVQDLDVLDILWFGLGAMSILIICRWTYYYGSGCWKWLRLRLNWLRGRFCNNQQLEEQCPLQRSLMGPPLILGSPFPYGDLRNIGDPPPYSAEDPLDSLIVRFRRSDYESPEGEVAILSPASLPVRTDPVHTLASTLDEEEEMTV